MVDVRVDTTDVQWARAEQLANGSLLLKCGFAEGSPARGCQLTLHLSHTGKVRIVVQLLRSNRSREVWEVYEGAVDWGTRPYLLVSDIEEDGATSTTEVQGNISLLTTVVSETEGNNDVTSLLTTLSKSW